MDEFVITCVQQQIRVFESHGEFRTDIQRFMRLAKIKESHLVVFPELCGLLLAPPLVPGLKRTLLRVAERQVKRKPSLIDRMVGRLANSATDALGGIGGHIMEAFASRIDALRDAYLTIFSETAREYEMYILAGSIYLPDARDGQVHNTAYLFGPTGEVIGQQSKITLDFADTLFCKPATTGLEVFDTDFGKLGILIGQDVLFPESGRILNALGAGAVAHVVAAPGQGVFSKLRNALTARLQENLLLGAQSCLVGKNIVISLKHEKNDYIGKSAILAPAEMTTRYSSLLGEVGSMVTDGVISGVWDMKGLYELRSTIDIPVNEPLNNQILRRQIQALYRITAEAPAQLAPSTPYMLPSGERPHPESEAAETEAAQMPDTHALAPESEPEHEAPEPDSFAAPTQIAAAAALPPAAESAPAGAEPAETHVANIDEFPPLPLVYVEVQPETVAAADGETPISPSGSQVSAPEEPAVAAEQPGDEIGEELTPMQLRVPEDEALPGDEMKGEEPAPTGRAYADLWPALEELAGETEPSPAAPALDVRLLANPAAPTMESIPDAVTVEEFADDPEADESAAFAGARPSEAEEPELSQDNPPAKRWWPFSRR